MKTAEREMRDLLNEAPKFFSHHEFDGEKLEWLQRMNAVLAHPPTPEQQAPQGYALAMAVLQSSLYHQLDDEAKAQCDAMLSASPAAPEAAKPENTRCPVCNGANVIGTPGERCPFCAIHELGDTYSDTKPETELAQMIVALWDAIEEYAAAGEAGEAWTGTMQEHAAYVLGAREKVEIALAALLAADRKSDHAPLLRMLSQRARSFPDFPMGYHMPEVFKAVGEEPPEPADSKAGGEPIAAQIEYQCVGYIDGYDRNIRDESKGMKSPQAVYVRAHRASLPKPSQQTQEGQQ